MKGLWSFVQDFSAISRVTTRMLPIETCLTPLRVAAAVTLHVPDGLEDLPLAVTN